MKVCDCFSKQQMTECEVVASDTLCHPPETPSQTYSCQPIVSFDSVLFPTIAESTYVPNFFQTARLPDPELLLSLDQAVQNVLVDGHTGLEMVLYPRLCEK